MEKVSCEQEALCRRVCACAVCRNEKKSKNGAEGRLARCPSAGRILRREMCDPFVASGRVQGYSVLVSACDSALLETSHLEGRARRSKPPEALESRDPPSPGKFGGGSRPRVVSAHALRD